MVKLFISWAAHDRARKESLISLLAPRLQLLDIQFTLWSFEHIVAGHNADSRIVGQVEEADYGLCLLSPNYLVRPYILEKELPEFVAPTRVSENRFIPIALVPFGQFAPGRELPAGIQGSWVTHLDSRAFSDMNGLRGRERFADHVATEVHRRILYDLGRAA